MPGALDFAKIHKLATPTFSNGKWWKPKMSKMELRQVKKLALIAGVEWQDPPSMQKKERPIEFVRHKGIAHDRRIEQRLLKQRELAQGQLRQWAEINRQRRDKNKEKKEAEKTYGFVDMMNYTGSKPKIPENDTIAWEAHYDKIARQDAKEKYWGTLLKGSTVQKKLSSEERLAKRRAEREQKKKEKAGKQAAKAGEAVEAKEGESKENVVEAAEKVEKKEKKEKKEDTTE